MAKKQKRKLSKKQKLAGFGGKRAQSLARSRKASPAKSRKSTKRKSTKRKKSGGTNVGAIAAAGVGGLLAGGAAGYFTHDQVQGLLQNLANGDVPVLSGLAGLIAGQGNGIAPVYDLGDNTGTMTARSFLNRQANALGLPGSQQMAAANAFTGEAANAIATGQATSFMGDKDSMGFPIGVYQMDEPFWAKQERLGTI